MDFFQVISSLNKVGIGFFVLTIFALIFEIVQFRREKTSVKPVVAIPDFPKGAQPLGPTPQVPSKTPLAQPSKKPSIVPIVVTALILVILGVFSVAGFFLQRNNSQSQKTPVPQQQPEVRTVKSSGVLIFDTNWRRLTPDDLSQLTPGTQLYIGIASIKDTDVDGARIRVNKQEWTPEDETTEFNPDENVYYIQYTVPEGVSTFAIEAQLHTAQSGWPL